MFEISHKKSSLNLTTFEINLIGLPLMCARSAYCVSSKITISKSKPQFLLIDAVQYLTFILNAHYYQKALMENLENVEAVAGSIVKGANPQYTFKVLENKSNPELMASSIFSYINPSKQECVMLMKDQESDELIDTINFKEAGSVTTALDKINKSLQKFITNKFQY